MSHVCSVCFIIDYIGLKTLKKVYAIKSYLHTHMFDLYTLLYGMDQRKPSPRTKGINENFFNDYILQKKRGRGRLHEKKLIL